MKPVILLNKMKPKKIEINNPLFLYIEGEGMCQEGMVEIQQLDGFDEETWNKLRIPYEQVPLLIKALQSKLPIVTEKNYDKWDIDVFNRTQ